MLPRRHGGMLRPNEDVHNVTDGQFSREALAGTSRRISPTDTVAASPRRSTGHPVSTFTFPDEGCNETVSGTAVDVAGRGNLAYPPRRHHLNTVKHRQRLALVVGHEDRGDAELALDLFQLNLRINPRRFLSSAENGSSSKSTFRPDHERARQCDALLLAPPDSCRGLRSPESVRLHQRRAHLVDPARNLLHHLDPAESSGRVGDIVGDAHMPKTAHNSGRRCQSPLMCGRFGD